jgi:hypothetical protein
MAADLPSAIRGCWASAFSPGVLARSDEAGVDPGTVRIGVLVQPHRAFEWGGTARVRADGSLAIDATPGGPAGVVGGREDATEVVVDPAGHATGAGAEDPAPFAAVAGVARRAADALGAASIEWGSVGGEVYLLQIGPGAAARASASTARPPAEDVPAGAERVAGLAARFAGPLAEELVLPWALGRGDVPHALADPIADPRTTLLEARALSDLLIASVWGDTAAAARTRAASVSRRLLSGRIAESLQEIDGLGSFEVATAARLFTLVAGLGHALADRGLLPSAALVWRLTVDELDGAVAGRAPALRRGPGRWEPFVAEVVRTRGKTRPGTPAAGGVAAGRVHRVLDLRGIGRPGPRAVVVAPRPLPQLAPLLWHAAGLVVSGGSTGAHLFEVARSLGVPAAILDSRDAPAHGQLVAVDGEAGVVSVLPEADVVRAPSADVPELERV